MPLSLNKIRARAACFANELADVFDENSDVKSFWDGFFRVFGQELIGYLFGLYEKHTGCCLLKEDQERRKRHLSKIGYDEI